MQQANRPNLKKIMQQLADSFGSPAVKQWVESIEDPLDYEDPAEREAVIRRNIEMMKSKSALIQHFSNISPESATQFVNNPGNFEYKEWQDLEQIKHDLKDYEAAVTIEGQSAQIERATQAAPSGASEAETRCEKKKVKKKMGSYRGWIPS